MEQKAANYSRLSEENAEDMQVLRYEISEEYRDHPDYLSLKRSSKEWEVDGGNRVATILIYIGLPEEGGETVFPKVPKPDWQVEASVSMVKKVVPAITHVIIGKKTTSRCNRCMLAEKYGLESMRR